MRRVRPYSRLALALLVLALLGALASAAPAVADVFTPESESGSPNAVGIDGLYKIVLYIGILIFLLVEGTLIFSLVKYRFRRGAPEPAQVRGNTPLELGWTVGAAMILVVIAVITFVYLGDIDNPPASDPGALARAQGAQVASVDQPSPPRGKETLEIGVNMQQYLFRYDYLDERRLPGGRPLSSYYELVVPVKTTVLLKVTSSDVIHAWWVPKLGGKVDGVPGYVNETWFKVPRPGVFRGQCAELCGDNHADMRTLVRVVSPAAYRRWVARQRRGILADQAALARSNRQAAGK